MLKISFCQWTNFMSPVGLKVTIIWNPWASLRDTKEPFGSPFSSSNIWKYKKRWHKCFTSPGRMLEFCDKVLGPRNSWFSNPYHILSPTWCLLNYSFTGVSPLWPTQSRNNLLYTWSFPQETFNSGLGCRVLTAVAAPRHTWLSLSMDGAAPRRPTCCGWVPRASTLAPCSKLY